MPTADLTPQEHQSLVLQAESVAMQERSQRLQWLAIGLSAMFLALWLWRSYE